MKFELNPLDVKPTGELTLYGDARPFEDIRKGDTLVVNGAPYRVLDVTDDGNSSTYKLEPAGRSGGDPVTEDNGDDVAQYRGVIAIEWPAATRPGPYGAMIGRMTAVTDLVTGKEIRTCTGITVNVDMDRLVTADLTLFADADGEPILDGEPVLLDAERGEFRTAVFPFLVGEMRVKA